MLDLLPMLSHNFPLLLYSLTEFSRLVFFTCSPFIPFLSPKQITYIPIISWRILENLMGVLSYYIHWQLCCLFVALTFLPYSSELDHLLQWCTTCSLKLPVLPGFLPTLNFFFFFGYSFSKHLVKSDFPEISLLLSVRDICSDVLNYYLHKETAICLCPVSPLFLPNRILCKTYGGWHVCLHIISLAFQIQHLQIEQMLFPLILLIPLPHALSQNNGIALNLGLEWALLSWIYKALPGCSMLIKM